MGTNYYLREDACDKCGRSPEALHIGKSSMGWCFALHVIPDEGLNSLEDWKVRWSRPSAKIFDEYGTEVTTTEMLNTISNRGRPNPSPSFDYAANDAVPGPNNLIRHEISRYCSGHGPGTWDLIPGEFS